MKQYEGSVKWFNKIKGYGFISRANENDIYVHYKNINSEGRRTLLVGQVVLFNIKESDKGVQATQVIVIA